MFFDRVGPVMFTESASCAALYPNTFFQNESRLFQSKGYRFDPKAEAYAMVVQWLPPPQLSAVAVPKYVSFGPLPLIRADAGAVSLRPECNGQRQGHPHLPTGLAEYVSRFTTEQHFSLSYNSKLSKCMLTHQILARTSYMPRFEASEVAYLRGQMLQ